MFEPEPPREMAGMAYERWVSYWYMKFQSANPNRTHNPEYWHDCRIFIEERWADAMRKLYGVQKLKDGDL